MATSINFSNVMGYYSPHDIAALKGTGLENFMIFHNVATGATLLLSPLVGLVRAIVAAVTLYFYNKQFPQSEEPAVQNRKFFLMSEMARGGLEIIFLGPLLAVVDLIISLYRYQLLCFAPNNA